MRITRCDDQFLMALDRQEASRLMDACAMVVLASQSTPEARLPADLATLLCDLFQGLQAGVHPTVSRSSDPRSTELQGS
jgi:hypothetical protein